VPQLIKLARRRFGGGNGPQPATTKTGAPPADTTSGHS